MDVIQYEKQLFKASWNPRSRMGGRRNGPPYPLDYEEHSSKEKRESSKDGVDLHNEDDKSKKKTGLTDKQKKAIKIGAGIIGASILLGVGFHLIERNRRLKQNVADGQKEVENLLGSEMVNSSAHLTGYQVLDIWERSARSVNGFPDDNTTCPGNALGLALETKGIHVKSKANGADIGIFDDIFGPELRTDRMNRQHSCITETGAGLFRGDIDRAKKAILRVSSDKNGKPIDGAFGLMGLRYSTEYVGSKNIQGHFINWVVKGNDVLFKAVSQDGKSTLNDASSYFNNKTYLSDTAPCDFIRLDEMLEKVTDLSQLGNSVFEIISPR